MTRSLILSGAGDYADPWHDFPGTSRRLARILADLGHEVRVSEDILEQVGDLDGVDVLVVNAAAGPSGVARAAAQRGLDRYLARGGGILAVHSGVCALLDLPSWPEITGAAWIPGRTMHPPLGPCRVDVLPQAHPITATETSFELVDERYTHLGLREGNTVLATHEHEGATHPLVWARTINQARVVSDVLGHGLDSYDSQAHRALIGRSARWLAGDSPLPH